MKVLKRPCSNFRCEQGGQVLSEQTVGIMHPLPEEKEEESSVCPHDTFPANACEKKG
jgi:hypothetical protein